MLKAEVFAVMFLFLVPLAYAKDVSMQQAGYNNALQKMEKAENEYNSDARAVANSEKVIEREKKRLLEEQKRAEVSKAKYLEAKDKLEQAQAILDKAWKE